MGLGLGHDVGAEPVRQAADECCGPAAPVPQNKEHRGGAAGESEAKQKVEGGDRAEQHGHRRRDEAEEWRRGVVRQVHPERIVEEPGMKEAEAVSEREGNPRQKPRHLRGIAVSVLIRTEHVDRR